MRRVRPSKRVCSSKFELPKVEFEAALELELPRMRVLLRRNGETPSSSPPPLLVLGGRAPEPDWLRKVSAGRETWALDRGADACRAAGVVPTRILGDFDSVSEGAREWAERMGTRADCYSPDKDDTDFQLALRLLSGDVLVTGCWGGRFDHAFSNVFSSLGAMGRGVRVLWFADEHEVLFPLWGPAKLELDFESPPSVLSLLSLTASCEGVSIENVKWPLDDVELAQGSPREISNVPLGRLVRVEVCSGVLGVYGEW